MQSILKNNKKSETLDYSNDNKLHTILIPIKQTIKQYNDKNKNINTNTNKLLTNQRIECKIISEYLYDIQVGLMDGLENILNSINILPSEHNQTILKFDFSCNIGLYIIAWIDIQSFLNKLSDIKYDIYDCYYPIITVKYSINNDTNNFKLYKKRKLSVSFDSEVI